MLAAVTGGTGFIGTALVRRLAARGDRVRVLARASSSTDAFAGLAGVEIVRGDLFDAASLRRLMVGVDGLFHLAADLTFWRGARATQDRVNIAGTEAVMREAKACAVPRIVHASSVAAVGIPADPDRPADEDNPFSGDQYGYFRTKHAAEQVAFDAGERLGLDVVAINPGTVFGGVVVKGRKSGSQRIVGMVDHGVRVPLTPFRVRAYPPGGYNLCDIDDVVAGTLAAFTRGRRGHRYILGGHNKLLREVFGEIARQLGVPRPIPMPGSLLLLFGGLSELGAMITGKMPAVTWDYAMLGRMRLFYDSSKAIRELGYAITPFEETVAKGVSGYRAASVQA